MALTSASKKSTRSDSDSESDDVVRDVLPFLRQENERLGSLLDNPDDMLREAKKMRKELRASLEDARTTVAELETQVLTQNVHLAPSTQQAEQASFTRAKNHKTCQSIVS
jgi:predicted  nucleic acid-binding Zn-ribbon protein